VKVKPKEVLLNLPVALLFDEPWEIASFAANINAILHGKVRLKAEELGSLGGRYVGLFYLQRNNESQEIHDEFMRLIEEEEITQHDMSFVPSSSIPPLDNSDDQKHGICHGCVENDILHQKGLDHCVCGEEWVNGKCSPMMLTTDGDNDA
jgi:hypothetical protein